MKTLKDVLPYEFERGEFNNSPAMKYADVNVVREVDGCIEAWPGTHKHVMNWYILENGVAVGWNENPAVGWSFPIKRISKD